MKTFIRFARNHFAQCAFGKLGARAEIIIGLRGMARPDYCRRQAELLFAMAFAVSDQALAERLRLRAEQYMLEADVSDDPGETFERAIEDFNDDQMRGT
jgi:hypothetical protein